MLDQVLEKINLLKEKGLIVIPQSINLSRSDFDACDIVEEIRRRVDDAGVSRDKISIEITESTIGSNIDFIKRQVERFQELGFPVWMDDFGSGYSSFDVLQSIHFDLLKFDMSFMRKLDDGENGKIILNDLMRMATKLGLETICEGVETEEQVRFLQEIGCAKLQGYYFSMPIPFSKALKELYVGPGAAIENPEEEKYYKAIGQADLYDFSEITDKEEPTFQNVFSTIPMGILEISPASIHYMRTNQAYRDLLKRFFGIDISGSQTEFTVSSSKYNPFFMDKLRECSENGHHHLIDEPLTDGSVMHSFVRKISVNPVTGTSAIAIAVLSVSGSDEGTTYSNIARALARNYYYIYYVDLDTEQYIEYSLPSDKEELAVEKHGEMFFESARRDAGSRIYEEDRDFFLRAFTKEKIVQGIEKQGAFTLSYRLMDSGGPIQMSMKITRLYPDGNSLIIGVSVMDALKK